MGQSSTVQIKKKCKVCQNDREYQTFNFNCKNVQKYGM